MTIKKRKMSEENDPGSLKKDTTTSTKEPTTYKKKPIPKALREQVWISSFGKVFEHKCYINWCSNTIDVFSFESGHNIPESKGGLTVLENLKPLCSRCNKSMNDKYTIDEFNKLGTLQKIKWWKRVFWWKK